MHSLRAKSILLVSLFIIFAAYSSVYADITVSINYYGQDHYGYEASSVNAKAGDTYSLHVVNHSGGSINWKWTWLGPQDQGVWLTSIGSKNVDARFIPFNTNNWLYTFTVEIWKTGEGEGGGPHTIDGSGAINQPDITITEPVVDKYVAKDSETTVSVTATVGHGEEGWANQPVTIWILKNGTGSPLYSHNLTTGGSGTATYQYSPGSWDTAEHETRAKINEPIKTYVDEGNYSITVFKAEITEPAQVTRGQLGTIVAVVTPTLTPDKVEWVFTGGSGGTKTTTPTLSTSVILVDGDNDYTVTCKVTKDSAVAEGAAAITVNPRTGASWQLTPTCATDNETGWGIFPTITPFGQLRDKTTNDNVVVTPTINGFTVAQIDDPNGPNDDYWYIESTILKIDMETVINKYIKPGTTPPTPPGINWHEYNESQSIDADGHLVGVKGHEYRGTTGNEGQGHFAFCESAESANQDIREMVETKWDASDGVLLNCQTQTAVDDIAGPIDTATRVEPSGNWGPPNSIWIWKNSQWSVASSCP